MKQRLSFPGMGMACPSWGAGPVVVITAGITKGYKGLSSAFFL